MVLSDVNSGSPSLASTGDFFVPSATGQTMQAATMSVPYTCTCPECPPPPPVKCASMPATYQQLPPYKMSYRTTAVTVIQSSMPLTTNANIQSQILPNPSAISADKRLQEALKRPLCSIPNCGDFEQNNCDSKRQRRSSPHPMDRQGLYGTTPITPLQGMVDPRSSLFTATECHLATLQDEDGDTPLHIAVVQGNLPLVEKLIQLIVMSGKNIDIYNTLRQTPLHLAVITNQWQMVRHLVMVGADGNLTDRNGQTAVHLACQRSNMECLHSLIMCSRHPIDLNTKNYEGFTPLHLAVLTRNTDVIRFLLSKGADIDRPDGKSGRTALFHAVENEQIDLIEILLDHRADVNAQSYSGNTALHVASGRGFISVVRSLLRHGADMSVKNSHCDTAVTVAKDTTVSKVLYKIYRPEPRSGTPEITYRKRNMATPPTVSQQNSCKMIKRESNDRNSGVQSPKRTFRGDIREIKKERLSSSSSDEGFSSRPSSSQD